MQELFSLLTNTLSASGKNSPEVEQVLCMIREQSPQLEALARAINDGWATGPSLQAQPVADQPSTDFSFTSWKFIVPILAALGVGTGGGAGIANLSWEQLIGILGIFNLPPVTDYRVLLAWVAGIGALVGLAHSFYRNNWTLVLPTFSRTQNQFKVASFGCDRRSLGDLVR